MEQPLNLASNAALKRNVADYTLIVIGAFFQALSYVLFLAPYKIVPGGVYGISIVLHYVTKGVFSFMPDGLPMGATALCFNIPLMILAMKKIGLASGPKTIVTFVLISTFTDSLSYLLGNQPLVENDSFIACFYGGAILGIGVTCVFRAQSTSAGTDVLARVIANNSNLKVSNMIIVLDSLVVLLGLIVFRDWAVPLYSWFTIFVYGKIVEMFQTENPNRAVFIVSRKTQEIKELIVGKMGMRGTFLHGRGMYEGKEKEIIFTIAERKDLPRLKDEVKEIDPNAFISTMHASKDSPRPGI
ncbi:YitT family protein [Parabacteroides acidifaciens]|uniref:YitT family protein n=1 Tax=Parabacteroides acidifaciens TaxID=2290935 RepID=A0A3D8HDY1_9BACT|nr:YitT family protein [Parabacteroides acidifaciens]MBC8602085.1 YitT family protein [Parabacteroides acidifaciens]RDU49184.1 YitT family protein [Parabacteroides acidifaciens]